MTVTVQTVEVGTTLKRNVIQYDITGADVLELEQSEMREMLLQVTPSGGNVDLCMRGQTVPFRTISNGVAECFTVGFLAFDIVVPAATTCTILTDVGGRK